MKYQTIRDVDVAGKKVIHHCDFNIKLKKDHSGQLVPISDVRLKAYFPSIFYLINHGCKIVFISWLERPGGKVVESLRTAPIAKRLSQLINRQVHSLNQLTGPRVRKFIDKMESGEMVMLENTRFYPGEETDNDQLARQMAQNGDLMVMDAFGHAHRVHASVTGIPRHIPTVAGFYLLGEIQTFNQLIKKPQKPLVLIVGGTKTYDKINAVRNLVKMADFVLVGGAVANNFLKAKGVNVQNSFLEEPFVDKAKKIKINPVKEAIKLMDKNPKKIILPIDFIAADQVEIPQKSKKIDLNQKQKLPKNWAFMDIGPKTIAKFLKIINKARTIFWDGPLGKYEDVKFRNGTLQIAQAIAESKGVTILAGGDTAVLAENFGLIFQYTHVSIAGGAALEYLAGKKLPGIKALLIK